MENRWKNELSEYQWEILNKIMRKSDKEFLLDRLRNLSVSDKDEAFGLDMNDVKFAVKDLIQKVARMEEKEVHELFLFLPVDPFCGVSLYS